MAALLVALLLCALPQLHVYAAVQKCSVIIPVSQHLSWVSQRFSSLFSYAYLMSLCGRRRPPRSTQEPGEAGQIPQRMRDRNRTRSCGRSSKLSSRSWSYLQDPYGTQLRLLVICWSFLMLLPGMPFRVAGMTDLLRLERQSEYSEDWSRDTKGAESFSQLSGLTGRRYKHGEPPPGEAQTGSESLRSTDAGGQFGSEEMDTAAEFVYLDRFGNDCLRVMCSPVAGFDLTQTARLDEIPPLISKPDSLPFHDPGSSSPHVSIRPSLLEWGSQPVFEPVVAELNVINTCNSTKLKVFQPFSTDEQFYIVGFEEQVVDPGGELSITIVFRPRVLGIADAMLILQTSAGGFLVQAQGKGIASAYRVQALQGLRVSFGETIRVAVTLHNPHDEALTVGEVYAWPKGSTESSLPNLDAAGPCEVGQRCVNGPGDRALGFAMDQSNLGGIQIHLGPAEQLQIEPQLSSLVAELEFAALSTDRYLGSLHIKLFLGTQEVAGLIIPIDILISAPSGDSSPVEPALDVLDFGILTKLDLTSTVDIVLYNPGPDAVEVEDILLHFEDQNVELIEYRSGHVLPPNQETQVARVVYRGLEETVPSWLFECDLQELFRDRKLLVRTNSSVSPVVEVPYRALVLHRSMECGLAQHPVDAISSMRGDGQVGSQVEERVHFEDGLSVPLPLFADLERIANSKVLHDTQLVSSVPETGTGCCHKSPAGQLEVSVGKDSIVDETELLYPLVQIGKEELLWVHLTNPTGRPVHVQGLMSSRAEASKRQNLDQELILGDPAPDCSQGVLTDSLHLSDGSSSSVFYFAEGALDEVVIEPYNTSVLGPVVFRPSRGCLWTGLLSVWNNLTHVEWVPLRGSGGSGSLTFFDGGKPIDLLQLDFNQTEFSILSGVMGEQVGGYLNPNQQTTVCTQTISRGFRTKNTGDIHLDVTAVTLVGGGCADGGFRVESCRGFSLAPGQTADLFVTYQPNFTVGVFRRVLEIMTSAGVIQIPVLANMPDYMLPLCSAAVQSTNLERAFLYLSIVALVVVLGVFLKMLVREMSHSREQVSGPRVSARQVAPAGAGSVSQPRGQSSSAGVGSVSQTRVSGRQAAAGGGGFAPSHSVASPKSSSHAATVSGRVKPTSSGEPEVQSRTGDGSGASGPGRPKDNTKGRPLKSTGSEDSKTDGSSASALQGLRVKIPNSAALNVSKSNLGSPMRETPSPSSSHSRKADKRRSDALQAKIVADALENIVQVPLKLSPAPVSPIVGRPSISAEKNSGNVVLDSISLAFPRSQQLPPQALALPIKAGVVSGSPLQSPRTGGLVNQPRQVAAPKSQPQSPKTPGQMTSSGFTEKSKSSRKKRRSNMGTVKHELVAKGRSGSSSPSSSPASPATPASPSRPISPLHHGEPQPNLPVLSPPGFPSKPSAGAVATGILPLSRLDVASASERRSSVGKGNKQAKEPGSPSVYCRGDNLSVDVASTALREMAQAKASESWSALSGKGNRLADRSSDATVAKQAAAVPKDWVTVARKASAEPAVTSKEDDSADDRSWDRRPQDPHSGHGSSPGPSLTPSVTFPRRQDQNSGWNLPANADTEQEVVHSGVEPSTFVVPASNVPAAARAPGAKIAKPFFDQPSRDVAWITPSAYSPAGKVEVPKKRTDTPPGSADSSEYNMWAQPRFEVISRGSTFLPIAPTSSAASLQSATVQDPAPSLFSSAFPEPSFPNSDALIPALTSSMSGLSGFSVFSQNADIDATGLPSNNFSSPRPYSPRPVYPDKVTHPKSGFRGLGLGNSLPGSPRKPRAPYSPPLGPGIATKVPEAAAQITPELPTNDLACSFWSGSTGTLLQ